MPAGGTVESAFLLVYTRRSRVGRDNYLLDIAHAQQSNNQCIIRNMQPTVVRVVYEGAI